MRFIFMYLLSFSLGFSSILSLNEAFKIRTNSYDSAVLIDIELGRDIYLYSNRLRVHLNENDITHLINLPPSTQRQDEKVYYKNLNLTLPNILLERSIKYKDNLIKLQFQGCSEQGLCYNPQTWYFDLVYQKNNFELSNPYKELRVSKDFNTDSKEGMIANFLSTDNLFLILLTFFAYGLLLSLTPCILPMIPILSSLIVAKGGMENSKKYTFFLSLIYVFFMSLAYAIAGIIASFLGASVQAFLQKPIVLVIFSCIFIVLSLAMFDLFRFEFPLKFQNFIHKKNGKNKGVLSVATMGFLSALIIGPCVAAPLTGALIYIASSGDIFLGASALFIMSFGMGIPLLLVGLGLGFLKAGAWMQKLKIFFAFIMLAMSIWILSRILAPNYILIAFGILGVFFCVFMGIFERALSALAKIKKSILIVILTYCLAIFLSGIFKELDLNVADRTKASRLDYDFISDLAMLKEEIEKNEALMFNFTASWCESCKVLERITLSDERVRKRIENFKLIKIDLSQNSHEQLSIMREFGVFGPPVLIFFENTKENLRITGFIGPNDLLKQLERLEDKVKVPRSLASSYR